jgi:hypothetical protein
LLKEAGLKTVGLELNRLDTPLINSRPKRIAYDILSRLSRAVGMGDEIFLISRKLC